MKVDSKAKVDARDADAALSAAHEAERYFQEFQRTRRRSSALAVFVVLLLAVAIGMRLRRQGGSDQSSDRERLQSRFEELSRKFESALALDLQSRRWVSVELAKQLAEQKDYIGSGLLKLQQEILRDLPPAVASGVDASLQKVVVAAQDDFEKRLKESLARYQDLAKQAVNEPTRSNRDRFTELQEEFRDLIGELNQSIESRLAQAEARADPRFPDFFGPPEASDYAKYLEEASKEKPLKISLGPQGFKTGLTTGIDWDLPLALSSEQIVLPWAMSASGSSLAIGTIIGLKGEVTPESMKLDGEWKPCDGSTLPVEDYSELALFLNLGNSGVQRGEKVQLPGKPQLSVGSGMDLPLSWFIRTK